MSVNNITNYLKGHGRSVSFNTVSNYLGYLENSYIIHGLERYDIKGKYLLNRVCKYYANDLSFKNYLYSGFGYGIGYKLENLIYLDLRRGGWDVYTGVSDDKEVDFVAMKSDRKIYVQVAYSVADEETARREYAPLEQITDANARYVVSLDDFKMSNHGGIEHVQAWKFEEVVR